MAEYICPHCKNPINDDDALLCLFCGESLGRSVGFMGKLRYPRNRLIFIVVILILLASFVILMSR